MIYLHLTVRLSVVVGLVLGLGSCSQEKSDSSSARPSELRLNPPLLIREGIQEVHALSQLSQTQVVSALDTISFPGFAMRPSMDPVRLRWQTTCQTNDGPLVYKNSAPLEKSLFVSQLLPPDAFTRSGENQSPRLQCIFDFTAYQPTNLARHQFEFSSVVVIPPAPAHALRLLALGQRTNLQVAPLSLSTSDFGTIEIISDRASQFQIRCDSFAAELVRDGHGLKLTAPTWSASYILSKLPFAEDPRQACRVLGLREGSITAWSAHFILNEPVPGPQAEWQDATKPESYSSRRELKVIPVGTLRLTNTHPFPQIVRVEKSLPIEMIPLCVVAVRGDKLLRSAPGQPELNGDIEIIEETASSITLRIGVGGQVQMHYSFASQIECHCPVREFPLPNGRSMPSAEGDYEAGFFYRADPSRTLAILLDLRNGHPGVDLSPVGPRPEAPFRWAGNLPPRFTQPLNPPTIDFNRLRTSPGICK